MHRLEAQVGAEALGPVLDAEFALEAVCRTLGTAPEETLIVGDDLYLESSMARRGGALAGIVLTGTATREQLRETPEDEAPDLVVESLVDLGRLLAEADALRALARHPGS